jgi:hypothetical protein
MGGLASNTLSGAGVLSPLRLRDIAGNVDGLERVRVGNQDHWGNSTWPKEFFGLPGGGVCPSRLLLAPPLP